MARKAALRIQRTNTVINNISKGQEKALERAVKRVALELQKRFSGIELYHETNWKLNAVVNDLREQFPEVDFHYYHAASSMKPDGGILSIVSKEGHRRPVLIAEKKNQGTNDLRAQEGKAKQSKGNAIERLGKNVIGFRTAMKPEAIFPFVCFGDGCDFADGSSILDRVVTIAMFGQLNKEYLHDLSGGREFDRGSFYFRESVWTEDEMFERSASIAVKSVYYYFSKHGEEAFLGGD